MSKNNALKLAMMGYSLVASLAFFLSDGKYLRKEVVDIFFEMVKELHDVFETQTEYNFVGMTRFRTAATYLCSRCRLSLQNAGKAILKLRALSWKKKPLYHDLIPYSIFREVRSKRNHRWNFGWKNLYGTLQD